MNTGIRFIYEFISIFFDGIVTIGKGFWKGFMQLVNFSNYRKIINNYKGEINGGEWVIVVIGIIILLAIIVLILFLIFVGIKRLVKRRKSKMNEEDLLNEIADLNTQVKKLMKEKNEIMAMKVSQLGLKPDEEATTENPENSENSEDSKSEDEKAIKAIDSRFPKLTQIDLKYANHKIKNYGNTYTLKELIDNFRCFSATKLKLYYEYDILRPFFSGLACGKLVILQGISGTGKTSLAYAWGKFLKNDSCVASVEPSWRDKTELLGYFNEFTKKFNESDVLAELYEAGYDDDVHTIILDEMNIARVEYYFAEMLSILEMPTRDEWVIELVTSGWDTDPKNITYGKLKLPGNIWYIGTINNDDSTYMVTDKVYDRAMPIDINTKVEPFECREQDAIDLNSSYLEELFTKAAEENKVSEASLAKVKVLDDYVIKHFRIAFGNRIMKQMRMFVPVYVACGGEEVAGIDYFIAKKILRKFEQLNITFIKDEIQPFIVYLNTEFGKDKMKECIEYLERLKKSV